MKSQLDSISDSGVTCSLTSKFLSKVSSDLRMVPDTYPDNYGILTGSVLVSNELFNSPEGPLKMAKKFAKLPMTSNDILFTSNLGGRVNENKHIVETAMHPGWRSSAQLINFVRGVEPTIHGKLAALEELTNIQMPILYSLDPNFKVSYRNLGDPNEKDFRSVYWGENYERLLKIKRETDSEGLFVTKLGVGSEDWDEEGMCRKHPVRLGSPISSLMAWVHQLHD
ncbi:hypothetical protein DL770_000725 [Monosporascus sp. CRB-9-2]|nr:hypothetical protein DL770_000725 [Monosporascus sp. CRB-9-2]